MFWEARIINLKRFDIDYTEEEIVEYIERIMKGRIVKTENELEETVRRDSKKGVKTEKKKDNGHKIKTKKDLETAFHHCANDSKITFLSKTFLREMMVLFF